MQMVEDNLARNPVWQELRTEVAYISELLGYSSRRLHELDQLMLRNMSGLSSLGVNSMNTARRIVNALDKRLEEMTSYLNNQNEFFVGNVRELLAKRLVIPNDSLNSVIDTAPLPALHRSEWQARLDELFEQIEKELRPTNPQRRANLFPRK